MKDDFHDDGTAPPRDEDETPAIYSVSHTDGRPILDRRTFLEIATVAAGVVSLPTGCATFVPPQEGGGVRAPIAHKESVTALAVNASGKLLASGDKGGTLRLWQLPEGSLLHSWSGDQTAITDIDFGGGDETLWALGSSGDLKRWQLPTGEPDKTWKPQPGIHAFAIPGSEDWSALAEGKTAQDAKLYVKKKTDEAGREFQGLDDRITALEAASDGRLLLAGGAGGNVSLWTVSDAAHVRTAQTGSAAISALCIAKEGELALTAHADESLRTWQLPDLSSLKTYQTTLGKPFSVAIRPQSDLFVAGCEKPELGLWMLKGSKTGPRLLKGHGATVRAMVITPDGSLLISGSDDKTIRIWSLPDGKFVRNLIDLEINYKHVEGVRYEGTDVYGRTTTYTLPCGSPIPAGSVCTCNCVPGSLTIPRNHKQTYSQGVCSCNTICTCNTVCTCQSVGTGQTVSYWYPN